MIRWMIISTLATGLLYGLYCLTLRRDRWLQLSRMYLIILLAFSMALPLIPMPRLSVPAAMASFSAEPLLMLVEGEVVAVSAEGGAGHTVQALPLIYMVGVALTLAFLLVQFALQAANILSLRRRHSVYGRADGFQIPGGASLLLPPDNTAPYSFFNQIVVGTQDLSDNELRCILAHESLHVHRLHTLDLMFMRLLCCLAWFNPFAWLAIRELKAVHEFQADAASVGSCGREDYLRLLYRQITGTGYGHITNNFQSINIKKRINMMNTKKTRFGAWKLLAAVPVAALLFMVGCKNDVATPAEEAPAEKALGTVQPELFDPQEAPEGFLQPEYDGGTEALYKYLAENIHYPEQAKNDRIEGKVYVRFVVMDDGSVVNVEVARGIGGGCDEEAMRVVKAMPKWRPATYEGKPVNVQYVIPINFKLT